MKKIIASCAVMALFAQFADAKAAPAKDIKAVSADECNCEKDPFAGGYVSFGLGYGSTKDKLESDLTVVGTTEALTNVAAVNDMNGVLVESNNDAGRPYDTVTGVANDARVATITAKKNFKKNKNHHNMIGNVAAGWMWKVGSNGYLGLEGSLGLGASSTTSVDILNFDEVLDEYYHIDLKRSGTNLGVSGILGWKVAQSYLIYGKIGVRANSVDIVPPVSGSYSKKIFSPEFGLGFKRAMNNSKATIGLEASYVLNKKIKMKDQGKDYAVLPITGNNGEDDDSWLAIRAMRAENNKVTSVGEGDARAVVKAKRTGSWKVALTLTMPLG